jgi:dolichol-phosphate mannosyltransferase
MSELQFSIVIPAKDEAENLADVIDEIATVLAGYAFEIIVVDDGSGDRTDAVLRELGNRNANLRHLIHQQSCGKSAAVLSGVRAAKAAVVCTLDGDGQNDPRYLPALVALASEPGVGLAAGQRVKHAHSFAKKIGSRVANGLRRALLNDNTRDTACGLKAFPRDVYLRLPYFDTMHRFLPALVLREGLNVKHLDVVDRVRLRGRSKYGVVDRALTGMLDLVGVSWLMARRRIVPAVSEVSSDQS